MTARTNQRYFRTDQGIEYYFDGTRWLSLQLFEWHHSQQGLSATNTNLARYATWGGQDMWLYKAYLSCAVLSGGTNLSASHKWSVQWSKTNQTSTTSDIAQVTVDSQPGSYNDWFTLTPVSVGALVGTTMDMIQLSATKTGTPGNINIMARLTYRLVGT